VVVFWERYSEQNGNQRTDNGALEQFVEGVHGVFLSIVNLLY
jgi:hypothetical protein